MTHICFDFEGEECIVPKLDIAICIDDGDYCLWVKQIHSQGESSIISKKLYEKLKRQLLGE